MVLDVFDHRKDEFSLWMGELPLVGCLEISKALSQHPSLDDPYEIVTTKQVGGDYSLPL